VNDPEIYAVRLHPKASADIDDVQARMAASVGEVYANEWHLELLEVLASFATYPKRFSLASENRLFQNDVRVYPFRYRGSNVTYRILYEIIVDEMEAPYVYILHIRHGSRKPMTRADARKMEDED
jgi:plasmid stabilization system protein ParE